MKEVYPHLWVGDRTDYETSVRHRAVVSATKSVHSREVRYNGKDDPDYIYVEKPYHLILNWVDGPSHLYDWSTPGLFTRVNDFIDRNRPLGDILVHCDHGLSRSPTLALVYLAKRTSALPDGLHDAFQEFARLYPRYAPGGIFDYVSKHWREIT